MSRDKQIEEMVHDVFCSVAWKDLEDGAVALDIDTMTGKLYDKSYRKASDVARDVIMDVIEIVNEEYVKCHKWESKVLLAVASRIADLKKKYESEGADDE